MKRGTKGLGVAMRSGETLFVRKEKEGHRGLCEGEDAKQSAFSSEIRLVDVDDCSDCCIMNPRLKQGLRMWANRWLLLAFFFYLQKMQSVYPNPELVADAWHHLESVFDRRKSNGV